MSWLRPCRRLIEEERRTIVELGEANRATARRARTAAERTAARLRATPMKIIIATASDVERLFERRGGEAGREPKA